MAIVDKSLKKRAKELGIPEENVPAYCVDLMHPRPVPEAQPPTYEPVYTKGIMDIDPVNNTLYPNLDSYVPFTL